VRSLYPRRAVKKAVADGVRYGRPAGDEAIAAAAAGTAVPPRCTSRAAASMIRAIVASTSSTIVDLLRAEPTDIAAIASQLDRASHAERVEAIRSLGGARLQGRLWTASAASPPVTLEDLVPPDTAPLRQVVFEGKNSLPAFTLFQKRFCRPPAGQQTLWGYNHQDLAWLTGPGYFVVREEPAHGAAIDYREVPSRGCDGWPSVRPNGGGFSRFVYKDMVDYLRRVSRDVFIGSATRHGRAIGSYFLLCRCP
jgi:hypothetical protein